MNDWLNQIYLMNKIQYNILEVAFNNQKEYIYRVREKSQNKILYIYDLTGNIIFKLRPSYIALTF